MTSGPIIVVEDDKDDQELYEEAIRSIGIENEIRFFSLCKPALHYLLTTPEQPFIILSDINIPQMSGLEFKEKIQQDEFLRSKGIPFVFISTNANAPEVRKAHVLSVQGYFKKPNSVDEFISMIRKLFDYWALCKHINNT